MNLLFQSLRDLNVVTSPEIDGTEYLLMWNDAGSLMRASSAQFQDWLLKDIQDQINDIAEGTNPSYWPDAMNLTLAGDVVGTTSFDGRTDRTITTAIGATLSNRLNTIENTLDDKLDTTATAAAALKLQTARTINVNSGPVRMSYNFDGSANINVASTIADGALTLAMVNGLNAALALKVDRATSELTGHNLDTTQTGFYRMPANVVSNPVEGTAGILINVRDAVDGRVAQVQIGDTGRIYVAAKSAPTASTSWNEILHTGWFDPDSKLDSSYASTIYFDRGELGGTVDLNTVITSGIYFQRSAIYAASGTNYPVAEPGVLQVYASGSAGNLMLWQIYLDSTLNTIWSRIRNAAGVWSVWKNSYEIIGGISADDVTTGVFPVARGGTGRTTFTANNFLVGNGTSAINTLTPAVARDLIITDASLTIAKTSGLQTALDGKVKLAGNQTITGNTTFDGAIIGASLDRSLKRVSVLPSGNIESLPINFRFDQDVVRFVNRWGTATVTTSGFLPGEIDQLFSNYIGKLNMAGRPINSSIEITGININNSGNHRFFPYVFMHSSGTISVRMELLKSVDPENWVTAYEGTIGTNGYKIAEYTSAVGSLIGVRWTFYDFDTSSNIWIRWLGVIGIYSPAYAWNLMRGGDTMYGDLNFAPGYTAKINGKAVWHSGTFNPLLKLDVSAFTWANLSGKPGTFPPSVHSHALGEVTGIQTALDAKVDKTVTAVAGNGLTGGGTLGTNFTFTLGTPNAVTATSTNTVSGTGHTHQLNQTLGEGTSFGTDIAITGYPTNMVSMTRVGSATDTGWPEYGTVLNVNTNNSRMGQLLFGGASNALYFRNGNGNGWTDLQRIATTAMLDSAVMKDSAVQTISPTLPAWRLSAGTTAGNDNLSMRFDTSGAYTSSRGAILELNGLNAASYGGAFRLLAANGASSIVSGGGGTVTFQAGTFNFTGTLQKNGQPVWDATNAPNVPYAYTDKYAAGGNVSIPASVDLNTYTTPGIYHQNTTASAGNGTNYPVALAGMLEVYAASAMIYQRYTAYNGGIVYTRSYYNGTWYPWRKVWDDTQFNPANYLPVAGGTLTGIISKTTAAVDPAIHRTRTGTEGFAVARMGTNSADVGLGITGAGELAFGNWSTVATLSTSWNKVLHTGILDLENPSFGSTTDATTSTKKISISSNGYAGIDINGDYANTSGEPGGSFIRLGVDGPASSGTTNLLIGSSNTANDPGDGTTYDGVTANASMIGTTGAYAMQFGTNRIIRMTINSAGNTTFTGSVAATTVSDSGGNLRTAIDAKADSAISITAGNGLSGGGTLAATRTLTLGTPGATTLSSTNAVTTTSHTHAFTPGGTTAQYIRGDGSLAAFPAIPAGTVTSVTAGNGMSFTTINGTGAVTLGPPGTLTSDTANTVLATSHTHNVTLDSLYINDDRSGTLRTTPDTYRARSLSIGFNIPGNSGVGTGTYQSTLTLFPWTSYNTNYRPCQLVFNGTGDAFYFRRAASATTWDTAYKVYTEADPVVLNTIGVTAGNGLSGGGTLAATRTITLGTPTAVTLSSTNSVATASHTHAFTPGGTTAQYIRGDGTLATFPATVNTTGTQSIAGAKTFTSNVTAPDFVLSSDRRLKENIRPLAYRGRLNPVQYQLIDGDGRTEIGFIADDVQLLYPEAVYEAEKTEGYMQGEVVKFLSHQKLVPVLAKQVNTLEDEHEQTRIRLAQAEREIAELKQLVQSLLSK